MTQESTATDAVRAAFSTYKKAIDNASEAERLKVEARENVENAVLNAVRAGIDEEVILAMHPQARYVLSTVLERWHRRLSSELG